MTSYAAPTIEKTKPDTEIRYTVSHSDIITEQDQNVLMYVRDVERTNYFLIGDIANKYIELSARQSLPVTQAKIFDAVGRFCGKQGRTIRYYAETAAFYERDEREEFDTLPFSFFVLARKLGDDYRILLEEAALKPYITLDQLRAKFLFVDSNEKNDDGDEYDTTEHETDPDQNIFGNNGHNDPPVPVPSPHERSVSPVKKFSHSVLISTISDLVDAFDRLIERTNLPETTRERLARSLRDIRELIPEILQAINTQGD